MIELCHNGRPPFCNLRVSPSSELLHNQMWLHRFDVIWNLSCLGAIICDVNTIGFVLVRESDVDQS